MKKTFKILVTCLAILFFISCKPAQKVVYDISQYQPSRESVKATVSIRTFDDIRMEEPDNQSQLHAKDVQVRVNGKQSCINAEKLYKPSVGEQWASMFAKYLNQKAYFTTVLVNQEARADYYVTAKVKHFTGYQHFSTKAAVGSQFGLLGALATMKLKTEGKIIIELADVCLYDKNGTLVAELGDFKKEYDGDFPVDAYCYCIYRNVNQYLSKFNEELGEILFQEVKK